MSSFHDQVFSEIESARKLAAEFANRHARHPSGTAQGPREADRREQEAAAEAEIAALAAEEERLASEARERAELRAKARAEKNLSSADVREADTDVAPEPAKSRWNATAILNALAKLRAKERYAAEQLIRKARAIGENASPTEAASVPSSDGRVPVNPPAAPVRGMWMPSQGATQVWYFTSGGTRCGPVTFAELRTMSASRVLHPRRDMVWKEGMEDWTQAGLLDGLFERRFVPAETPDPRGLKPSKPVAALPTRLNAALASKHMSWPGIGRLALWLGMLLFPLVWSGILRWCGPTLGATFGSASMGAVLRGLGLLPWLVVVFLVLGRLVNLGMSRWWALGLAVPIVNLWIAFRCLCCPPGHALHRQMDRAGVLTAIATLAALPLLTWVQIQHPGLFSPSGVMTALHGWMDRAGTMIDSN